MRWRRKHVVLSLLAVGAGAVIGLVASRGRSDPRGRRTADAGATLRARVVTDPPPGATVVPASPALDGLPVARALVEWAAHTDTREEWVGDVVQGEAGRRVVDRLRGDLPHYRAPDRVDADHDGVYVACEGRVVVLTAAGWSVAPEVW